MSQLSARYLHNSGTLSRCGRAPDPAPSLGRHDMTPGGLRDQFPRHSNPFETTDEIFSLKKEKSPPPQGRLSWCGEAKPQGTQPSDLKGAYTQLAPAYKPRTNHTLWLAACPFSMLGPMPTQTSASLHLLASANKTGFGRLTLRDGQYSPVRVWILRGRCYRERRGDKLLSRNNGRLFPR